jgi:hypothetical protein
MKSSWKKIMVAIDFCAGATSVALADEQMPSDTTNNVAGMDTDNWRTMPTMSRRFIWLAATTDQKEIHLGDLALQKKAAIPTSNLLRKTPQLMDFKICKPCHINAMEELLDENCV